MEQQPYSQDPAMRKEVLATLKANPAATIDTVLGNWRYRQGGVVDEAGQARLAAIYREERTALDVRRTTVPRKVWWHFW